MSLLLEIRKKTGLSQRKMAEYLDISRALLSMAEIGLRELPKAAFYKVNDMYNELLNANEKKKKNPITEKDGPAIKKMKAVHQHKMEDCQFRATGLQRRLAKMQQQHGQAEARLRLINGMAKTKAARKNEDDIEWLEYHDLKTKKYISKKSANLQMLEISIEMQLGYAAVHEKILRKFFSE